MPTEFLTLPGVNEQRAINLRKAGFNSLTDLKNAEVKDLLNVDLISPTIARKIKQYLQEPMKVSDFEFLDESVEDREKFAMKFGENPGRLILKFRHSRGFRLSSPIMGVASLIIFSIAIYFMVWLFPYFFIIILYIFLPIIILIIIALLIDHYYWNLDFIRIYEEGFLLSRRKEGSYSNPPTTYWGFFLSPVWQVRFGYRYIPKMDVSKIYLVYVNGIFIGINLIDTHGRWISSNFAYMYKDYKNRFDEILETVRSIFGVKWESVFSGNIDIKMPWGFDIKT